MTLIGVTHTQETCVRNLHRNLLYSVQVSCTNTGNFQTQRPNQTAQFWSRASVQVSDTSFLYEYKFL